MLVYRVVGITFEFWIFFNEVLAQYLSLKNTRKVNKTVFSYVHMWPDIKHFLSLFLMSVALKFSFFVNELWFMSQYLKKKTV